MNPPPQRYRVFGIPADGAQEEQLVQTFDRAFEAAAFAKLLSAGGRYTQVRIEAPAAQKHAAAPADEEPREFSRRPGCLYKLAYTSTLLVGGLVSIALGFGAAFVFVVWLSITTGVAFGPGLVLGVGFVLSAGLTALVVMLHARVFRDREKDA